MAKYGNLIDQKIDPKFKEFSSYRIDRVLNMPSQMTKQAIPTGLAIKHLNILLADDDDDDRSFFKDGLKGLPLSADLTSVQDGEQLMHLLMNEAEPRPDVLFLDLNMPRKNGFECLSEMKQVPALEPIPVVVYSTSYEQRIVDKLYQNGAHYFMRKPSEFAQLKQLIQETLLLIARGDLQRPARENFVITLQEK